MRFKNLTRFLFGYKVTSRRPPQPEMTLIVRAAFVLAPGEPLRVPEGPHPLSQGNLTAEVFAPDDEERAGECLYPGDFADYKPRADVMLRGACHAPVGRPVTDCPVRFSVGSWSKMLWVVGPRRWTGSIWGDRIGDPQPFTRMDISYANAFGGTGYAPNPAGKGVGTDDLPTVEHAAERIRSKKDRTPPAGFGPVNPAWPERAERRGKEYGASYQKQRAPFYAEDFDFAYFNAAPPDQRLEGYLRGDEEVTFQNLHPDAPLLSTRLPGVRIRAFVNDVRGRFREVRMVLDTLFADLDAGRLYLTWRGLDPVEEDDLFDVRTVLVAEEPLAEEPRPVEEYRATLEAFEKDPVGLRDAVPERLRGAWDAMREGGAVAAPPEPEERAPDPLTTLQQKLGELDLPELAPAQQALVKAFGRPLPEGFDLRASLARAVNDMSAGPPPAFAPGASPRAALAGTLRRLFEKVEAVKADAASRGVKLEGVEKLDALLADPRLRALDPNLGQPEAPPEEPGPGKNLSGQDLRGRNLRGADLTGADLSDAILSRADLRGARLAGARLARAVLAEADLSDADLTGADLTQANLSRARAASADFSRAVLDKVNAPKAVFAGARLDEARGEGASFEEADLTGAKAPGAALEQCLFDRATLAAADLTGARLLRCRCLEVRAPGVTLERTDLAGTSFAGAALAGARLGEARGAGSIWSGALLEGADLRRAALPESHFVEVRAARARFGGADLRRGRFYRAELEGADLSQANLFDADLSKARLTKATLRGASLYDAKLLKASLEGADFTGANLRRSTMERT